VVPPWTLQDRLQKSLQYSGVSKEAMAEELRVSLATLNNYLAGRSPVRRSVLLHWAQVTGVDPVWLETGTPPTGEITGPGVQ
jgi:transcriptional regulator with XRE-family HTH domain